jgi:hypothetical protein
MQLNPKGDFKPMQTLKERKNLLIKILAVVFLVFMCCALSKEVFIWKVCNEPNRNPLEELVFWGQCEKEKEALFWDTCEEFDRNLPPNTELLISACTSPNVTGVPDGKILFVHEKKTGKMYLLDLRTGEKRDIPDDPLFLDRGIFLSSELVWLEGSLVGIDNPNYRPHYILDLSDGKRYELLDLDLSPRLEQGKFNPKYYAYFQSAEQVFIDHDEYSAIALAPDFRHHPEGNVILSEISLGDTTTISDKGKLLEQLMKDLGVSYQVVDFVGSYTYPDVPSPTGKYIFSNHDDNIYLFGTNALILNTSNSYFLGWYYDESGVIIQEGAAYLQPALLPESSPGFPVDHPILKLRLPERDYIISVQNTAAVVQTQANLTLAAMPTATPTIIPTTTYTPTATIVHPTWTPPPTQIFFPINTPDPIQLERWKEYEIALAQSLLPEFPQGSVFCEWVALGRSGQDVYVMAICGNIGVYATAPAVIHLNTNESIQNVEIVEYDSARDLNIQRLFPIEVQKMIYSEAIKTIREELAEHLSWRLSHQKDPPLIVFWATPMATREVMGPHP